MSTHPFAPSSALDELLEQPATLFDAVQSTGQLPPHAAEAFEVIVHPGQPPTEALQPHDLLVRRALGEGRLATVSALVDGGLHSPHEVEARGFHTESFDEGQYAEVEDLDPFEGGSRVARRLFDVDGRLPHDSVVLRPRTARAPQTDFGFGVESLAAEASSSDFTCSTTSTVSLHTDVVTAMVNTWNNSGEGQSVTGLCNDTPTPCPTAHQAPHATGNAAHFQSLSQLGIRVVELAGLWGQNLTSVSPQASRAAVSVKTRPTTAPAGSLSFVGIRTSSKRHIHVARETNRRVESDVKGERWTNLGIEAVPGTDYRVFKRRYFEASLHRQWGKEAVTRWLVGLANFYRDQTGELLGVGDVSHIVGEDMTDHGSHEKGEDVDIYALEAPPTGSTFPKSHWALTSSGSIVFKELTPPSATASSPQYGVPASSVAALTGTRATRVETLWTTLLAYCAANHGLLRAAVWHGSQRLRSNAVTLAQNAWDAVIAAGTGTSATVGWKASWGPGPTARTAISAPASKFIGDGSSNYGAGRGWPLHQDHIHVRFR